MKWFLIGLAAVWLLALLWEQIPGRVNMRWRGTISPAPRVTNHSRPKAPGPYDPSSG